MTLTISYGNTSITCSIYFVNRKTIGITVTPTGDVFVKAPFNAKITDIEKKVSQRVRWIKKQQIFFESFCHNMPSRRYVSGESHLYLGKQFILKIRNSVHCSVHYKGQYIEIECPDKSKVKDLMDRWYREKAKLKFADIAEPLIQRFKTIYSVEPSSIYIQKMNKRWGSCSNNGRITLNTELIKAPLSCIKYVIIHELCHLIHKKHTSLFFKLLSDEMPDWKRWKHKLDTETY